MTPLLCFLICMMRLMLLAYQVLARIHCVYTAFSWCPAILLPMIFTKRHEQESSEQPE